MDIKHKRLSRLPRNGAYTIIRVFRRERHAEPYPSKSDQIEFCLSFSRKCPVLENYVYSKFIYNFNDF